MRQASFRTVVSIPAAPPGDWYIPYEGEVDARPLSHESTKTGRVARVEAPRRQIVIADYDPRWAARFEEERSRIGRYVPWIVAMEHAGSTAVPGLAAKPIIDMLAAVRDLAEVEAGQKMLEDLGYEFLADPTLPERRYFRIRKGVEHTHHLHIYGAAGFSERADLLFRDYLRAHSETARRYGALKRELADQFPEDPIAYTEAKADFVRQVVALALVERGLRRSAAAIPSDYVIERAVPAHLAAVRELLAADGLVTEGLYEAFGFMVARDPTGIAGAAGLEIYGQGALLRSLVVQRAARGRGLGLALARAAIDWARELGVAQLYLLTTTAADFLSRLGFKRIERSEVPTPVQGSIEFSAECCDAATAMRLALVSERPLTAARPAGPPPPPASGLPLTARRRQRVRPDSSPGRPQAGRVPPARP